MLHLDSERIRFVELRRRILAIHPDLDDQTLADTLEGATDLKEALAAVIRSTIEDECLIKALRERIEAARQRLARLEARASGKRQTALFSMSEAELPKIIQPDFTASIRLGPASVEVVDERALPIEFLVPQPPRPDKRALLAVLSSGASIPGAGLAPARLSLSIRTS